MEGTKIQPVSRKLKILECSPFKDKTPWQSNFTSPVIENVLSQTHRTEGQAALKKSDVIAKAKPTIHPGTLYQDEYIEKDIPLQSRIWLPKEHLIFKGSMMTSSVYDDEFQKKNIERQGYCKRVQTLFKDLDTSSKGKIKSTYMDDFPTYSPKRTFYLPSLPKDKQRTQKADPHSRIFETETTYSNDYIQFNLGRNYRQAIPRVVASGILPRLPCIRLDPNFKKSVTTEELARVAERFPRICRRPCHPKSDSILKFDGKIYLDTLYDFNNYADPAHKRWFIGHRLDWKTPQLSMKSRKFAITSKIVGNPLTWRYV